DGIRLQPQLALARADRVLVRLPLLRIGDDAGPDPRRALRLERARALLPVVEIADHRDRPRVRRPDREGDAGLGPMRAEMLVEQLVPPLADEMEVELAERRHETGVPSSRRIPLTGITTHSGRLSSS